MPVQEIFRLHLLTHKRQPNKFELDDGDNSEGDPEKRLAVHSQPEEALVGRVDGARVRIMRFVDPVGIARVAVDLVPPSQSHESSSGNVLEVVEVRREKEDGNDEN